MRIHTDKLTGDDFVKAAQIASQIGDGKVTIFELDMTKGSRSHETGVEISLCGDGSVKRHRTQRDRERFAATHDAWGVFLAHLFDIEPTMKAGSYKSRDDFHATTRGAYA